MIEGLKPYPEYKESDIPWVTKMPSHWTVNRLRHASKMLVSNVDKHTKANELPVRLCNYVDVYKNERIHPLLRFMHASASKDEVARFRLCFGDVVITKDSEDWKDIGVPALVEHEAPDFVCGYHLAILRPRPGLLSGAFLLRILQCHLIAAQFHVEAHGVTRYGLGHGAIKDVSVPIPPPDEQAAIVRFLEHANRKIDGFIRAKRKLIGLLNEQKQAIIHRAVTRGLDPNAQLKPSGISWLGDVPAHWEVRRVKQVTKILRGKFTHRPRNDPSLYDGPYPFIQTGAVARAKKFITEYKQTLNERGLAVSKLFPKGTLCMTIAANIGDVAILDFEACFPDSIVGFVPSSGLNRDFLYLAFLCLKAELLSDAPVNTQGNLNVERIGVKWLPFPSIEEQKQIAAQVELETSVFATAIARTENEIALMQEYRTRLTADLVTGKLDVREAAAKLPEFVEEAAADAEIPDDESEVEEDEG